jgi:hypothetical protein
MYIKNWKSAVINKEIIYTLRHIYDAIRNQKKTTHMQMAIQKTAKTMLEWN